MISNVITSIIQQNLDEKNFSACALGVQEFGKKPDFLCLGKTSQSADATKIDQNALFDLSSLTKVVFTTTWIATLVQNENLPLHQPISKMKPFADFVHNIKNTQYLDVTLEDLLLHRAGFPAIAKYREICKSNASESIVECISLVKPEYVRGQKTLYSDLGFIFLTELLALYLEKDLETIWATEIQKPFQLSNIKTTKQLEKKDVVVQSVPNQENCVYDPAVRQFQKLCGHAGLWGSIQDVVSFGSEWLRGYLEGDSNLHQKTVRLFVDPYQGQERKLGWDGVSKNSTAGEISPTAIGHLGYTGTSIWIDQDKKIVVSLLTNRTLTQVQQADQLIGQKQKKDFNDFRRNVHNEIWRSYLS